MRRPVALLIAAALLAACAPGARAQEFMAPAPAGERSLAALLERGLAPVRPSLEGAAFVTRWYGLPELETRSLALAFGWRTFRVAAGASRTGDRDLGWSAAALAAGVADARGGAAFRACARERPAIAPGAPRLTGVEAGAGMWLAPGPALALWASAPQIWIDGDPPPLERWLEVGATVRAGDADLWLARAATPGAPRGSGAEHVAGVRLPLAVASAWLEVRDHPMRGGFGLAASRRGLGVAASIESHPVLGETVRLGLALGKEASP